MREACHGIEEGTQGTHDARHGRNAPRGLRVFSELVSYVGERGAAICHSHIE